MAIVDSSVLIPLMRIGKLSLLNEFFKKILITKEVYKEIESGEAGISEFMGKIGNWIYVHGKIFAEARETAKLERIEEADASLILLAQEKKDILLSNDFALIACARSKGIKCWWLTTFLLQCVRENSLKKDAAKRVLFDLISAGVRLDNRVYAAILNEIDKM